MKNLFIICTSIILFSNCTTSKIKHKQLLARITATEDRLEILNLLAGSAFSSDVASEAYWSKMFTEDAVFDRSSTLKNNGKTEILKIINSDDQKDAIKYGMTHLAMLPHITLKGESAVATGYLLIVIPDSAASHVKLPGKGVSTGFSIYHITANRWELTKKIEGWKVSKRTVRPITNSEARDLIGLSIKDETAKD